MLDQTDEINERAKSAHLRLKILETIRDVSGVNNISYKEINCVLADIISENEKMIEEIQNRIHKKMQGTAQRFQVMASQDVKYKGYWILRWRRKGKGWMVSLREKNLSENPSFPTLELAKKFIDKLTNKNGTN